MEFPAGGVAILAGAGSVQVVHCRLGTVLTESRPW